MKPVILNKQKVGLFRYLVSLTGLFIVLELSLFTQSSDLYLSDYEMIADRLHIPMSVYPGIIYFLCAQIFVHLLYITMIYTMMQLMSIASRRVEAHLEKYSLFFWALGLMIVLLINQIQFPNSKFAILTKSVFHPPLLAKILLGIYLIIFLFALFVALYGFILVCIRNKKMLVGFLSVSSLISFAFAAHHHTSSQVIVDASTKDKPNIIVIGVDALRPDFLGYFGAGKRTPTIDNFLNQATVFSESLTPLARTFPAWVSILTGAYPKNSNVRYNLSDEITFDLRQTLPAILQNHGYKTIFAMDETRFSNINKSFGFDSVITPPMGVNDFLIGTVNDFPLSNLIVNTFLGKYLFPYSYANRPVYTTYEPESFLKLLNNTLEKPRDKPLFLAVHFCITHYPYVWSDIKYDYHKTVSLYQLAINRVDSEIFEFLGMLKKNKLLDNTIVVMLSDHGEAFWLNGDRITEKDLFIPGVDNKKSIVPDFYPGTLVGEKLNQSVGHGTDVLGLPQSHTLLSFRFFGREGQKANLIPGWVSLLDIKPTILELLKMNASKQNGKSLTDYISGKKASIKSLEHFFIESDFAPEAVYTVHPETRKLLFQGIDFFQINQKSALLTVKKSMGELIISSKQYADFYGPWVLALYPQSNKTMIPVLVNLETGFWTNDLRTQFAKQSPADHMLQALKRFYGKDLQTILNN